VEEDPSQYDYECTAVKLAVKDSRRERRKLAIASEPISAS